MDNNMMPEIQTNLDNMTALELWSMLKQDGVLHMNILRGLLPLSKMQALHLAGATDYDSIKVALEAAQAEAKKWHNLLKQECEDWAETDTHIRNAAKKILPAVAVDGTRAGVPPIADVVDAVIAEALVLRGEKDSETCWAKHYHNEVESLKNKNAQMQKALKSITELNTIWSGGIKTNLTRASEIAYDALAKNETPL